MLRREQFHQHYIPQPAPYTCATSSARSIYPRSEHTLRKLRGVLHCLLATMKIRSFRTSSIVSALTPSSPSNPSQLLHGYGLPSTTRGIQMRKHVIHCGSTLFLTTKFSPGLILRLNLRDMERRKDGKWFTTMELVALKLSCRKSALAADLEDQVLFCKDSHPCPVCNDSRPCQMYKDRHRLWASIPIVSHWCLKTGPMLVTNYEKSPGEFRSRRFLVRDSEH